MSNSIAQQYVYQCQLHLVWTQVEVFDNATKWMRDNFKEEDAHWDYMAGRTWINNIVYPAAVFFKNEEDYLVFRLKFRELLKF